MHIGAICFMVVLRVWWLVCFTHLEYSNNGVGDSRLGIDARALGCLEGANFSCDKRLKACSARMWAHALKAAETLCFHVKKLLANNQKTRFVAWM
ncbi:MAG: hypothetical protein RJB60_3128 [Pseudomonadota bacterium]